MLLFQSLQNLSVNPSSSSIRKVLFSISSQSNILHIRAMHDLHLLQQSSESCRSLLELPFFTRATGFHQSYRFSPTHSKNIHTQICEIMLQQISQGPCLSFQEDKKMKGQPFIKNEYLLIFL